MSTSHDLESLQRRSAEVAEGFPGPQWTREVWLIDLVEEVGELASAFLTTQGHKSERRTRSDLEDSVGDVLFSLLMLCNSLDLELQPIFVGVLDDLVARQERGDFD